jgi:hypothetical protein
MKRLSLLTISLLLQIYAFAQRGRVRPEWDLMDNGEKVVSTSDDIGVTILFYIILFVLIVFFIWLKGNMDRNASKNVYVAKKDIRAYHTVSDFYKDRNKSYTYSNNYEYVETERIKKGTKCTEIKKEDANVCWAKFEGWHVH